MFSGAVATFFLVVLAAPLTIQGDINSTNLLNTLQGVWKRTFDVNTQTDLKLKAKGYDMNMLGKYASPALEAAEKCYDEDMKIYPDFAEPLKAEYKAGIANFPNEGWNSNMLDKMVEKTLEKESNKTAAALILSKVLGGPLICFRDTIKKEMGTVKLDITEEMKPQTNFTTLYDCVNRVYQGEWRNWNDVCNSTGSFWTRCENYVPCKVFENSNA